MKMKLNKKTIIIIIAIIIITIILNLILHKPTYDKKRLIGIEKINEETYLINIKNTKHKKINNCKISSEEVGNLHRNDNKYELTLKKYMEENTIDDLDALGFLYENKVLTENSKYLDYIVELCGFENEKELRTFLDAVKKDKDKTFNKTK